MKRFFTRGALALCGLFMLMVASATAQNTDRYVKLNVKQGQQISIDLKAPSANNVVARVVSGSTDVTVEVAYWTFPQDYYAGADTMVIYGDIDGIDCADNGTKVTGFDASHNDLIEYLDCSGCKIEALNVDNCSKLVSLYCYSNNISVLDISDCLLLKEFFCFNNLISEMDLTNHAKIEEIDCHKNNLTTLNVEECVNLIYLECHQNNFSANVLDQIYCDLPDLNGELYPGYIVPLKNAQDANSDIVLSTNANNVIEKNWRVVYKDPYLSDIPATTGNFICQDGVEELNVNNITISIAPNPAKNMVTIASDDMHAGMMLEIFDAYGRKVYACEAQSKQEISVADWTAGLYFVRMGNKTTKFIKQ